MYVTLLETVDRMFQHDPPPMTNEPTQTNMRELKYKNSRHFKMVIFVER